MATAMVEEKCQGLKGGQKKENRKENEKRK